MFDDLKQQNNQAGPMPQNQNVPPQASPIAPSQPMVDMFDTVDPTPQSGLGAKPSAVLAGKIKPVSNTSYVPGQPTSSVDPMMFSETSGNKLNKIIIILVVVLLVLALGAGAYYLIVVKGKAKMAGNENQNTNQNINTNENNNENTNQEVDMTDSDTDGLTDDEEAQANTNPLLADTDGDELSDREEIKTYTTDPLVMDTDTDGLNDGEEIKIWNTDPKLADTDNDSYPDGTEVKNGYSPTGPGKLTTTTPTTVVEDPINTQLSAAMGWGVTLAIKINTCLQASKSSTLTNYLLGADMCNPKINQNWPAAPDSYPKICVLDKVIQDKTWSIGLQSNSPDTLSSVICNETGCQRASVTDYPGGKVCP